MTTASTGAPDAGAPAGGRRPGRSRADVPSLVLAALLLVMGVTLAVDAAGIEAPRGSGVIGPAAFPRVVAGLLLLLGVVLALIATRGRPDEEIASIERLIDHQLTDAVAATDVDDDDSVVEPVPVGGDRPPFLRLSPPLRVVVFAVGLVAHALLLETAGYVVAALVLFVAVALAFGAPRLGRTVVGGAVLALAIFYAFTLGLGLALPNLGGR